MAREQMRLKKAIQLVGLGLSVVPIKTDGSKAAAADWKEYQHTRATNEELTRWFAWHLDHLYGLGIVCGKISGNLENLDFDVVGKYDEFASRCGESEVGNLLETMPLIETPSGGRHLLYRCEIPVGGNQKLAQQLLDAESGSAGARLIDGKWSRIKTMIETRGEGGYFVAPGSPAACHKSQKKYQLVRGDLQAIPVITAEQREALLTIARSFNEYEGGDSGPAGSRQRGPRGVPPDTLRPGDDFDQKITWEELLPKYGYKRLGQNGEVTEWQRPDKEGRGLSATTNYRGSDLLYVFSTNAAPLEANRAYSKFAVYAIMEHDGDFSSAARELAEQGYGEGSTGERNITDLGNAQRLVDRHGHVLHYDFAEKRWHWYDGQRWLHDRMGIVYQCAKETVRSIYMEVALEEDRDKRKEILGWASHAESKASIEGMIRLAQSEPGIPIVADDWDADLMLLNCQNGTLDLENGTLRPFRKEDKITKLAGAPYDPTASCPVFERFLETVLPDPDVRSFLQRFAGYSATGDVSEECLLLLHGGGRNGKSTFLNAIRTALGDYSMQAAPELLIPKNVRGGASGDVVDLKGARFVATCEIEDGVRLAEGLVKQITGKDAIKGRKLYQDHVEFKPTHKILFAVNHKPEVHGGDEGIWRRIMLIPFEVTISKDKMDRQLDKKLTAEREGILNWIVAGALSWRKNGLNPPECVMAATEAYREEMDVLRGFVNDCCQLEPSSRVVGGKLYNTYERWCEQGGQKVWSKPTFNKKIKEMPGISPATGIGSNSSRGWSGISIKPEWENGLVETISYGHGSASDYSLEELRRIEAPALAM